MTSRDNNNGKCKWYIQTEEEHTHKISHTSVPRTPLSVPINLGSLPLFHATAQFAAPVSHFPPINRTAALLMLHVTAWKHCSQARLLERGTWDFLQQTGSLRNSSRINVFCLHYLTNCYYKYEPTLFDLRCTVLYSLLLTTNTSGHICYFVRFEVLTAVRVNIMVSDVSWCVVW
jgi:hypothetical protein